MKSLFRYITAIVWIINGLYCKILNQVPRHQEIVEVILNIEDARGLTILIGVGEVFIALWIIIGWRKKLVGLFQILLVMTMNIIEFICVSDMLMNGRWNLIFAMFFCFFIYLTEFKLPFKKDVLST